MKLKRSVRGVIEKRLKFLQPEQKYIALEFAYRLAAYVEYVAKKLNLPNLIMELSSGYRDTGYQKVLFDKNLKEHPPKGDGKVAEPGNSWHEARCAVDVNTLNSWWGKYLKAGDYLKTAKQQEMYKFGLCIKLNKVDSKTVFEWWHIQPVETLSWTDVETRKKFLDWDDPLYLDAALSVYEFQAMMGLEQDGNVGPKTKAAAEKAKTMPMYTALKVKKVVDMILAA